MNFTNLVICFVCYSRYWLLYFQAVDLQINQTVENQGAFPESWGFRASVSSFLVTIPPRFFISFAHHIYIVILVLQQIGVNRLLQFPSMISGLLEFKVSSQRFETDVSYLWLLLGVLTQLEEIGRKIKSYIRVDSLIGGINTYISQLVLD